MREFVGRISPSPVPWIPVPRFHEDKLHGNDGDGTWSLPGMRGMTRSRESRRGVGS